MRKSDFFFRYRVRNRSEYNRTLVRRGSITFWVDEQAECSWRAEKVPGARGRSQLYADTAIECALIIKAVFHPSLRATQGFLESVVELLGIDLPVPDYTAVCKRQRDLQVQLGAMPAGQPRHVVIDTTGLKVFGAGEWYARKHGMGRGRLRTWRKLHLGVDEKTKDIVAVDLTTSAVHDSPHMPDVLDLVHDLIHQVSGDRACAAGVCYQVVLARGAVPTIPPRRNARLSTAKDPPPFRAERDAVIQRIKEDGRYPWRTSSGATRQSLAENAVSRSRRSSA